MSTMNNLEAIGLNNNAVSLFEKGLIIQAYEVLSNARLCLTEENERSPQEPCQHCSLLADGKNNKTSYKYGYHWVDFKQQKTVSTCCHLTSKSDNACLRPFICLYAVKISYCSDTMPDEEDCDCSIRWAVLHK
jgi:hypothetical protein